MYCIVGNALDPDKPAEGWRSVGVDLRMRFLFSSYSLHILGMTKTRKKKTKLQSLPSLLQHSTSVCVASLDSRSVTLQQVADIGNSRLKLDNPKC